MRRFTAVLLLPLDQQGTNQPKIDPDGVIFDPAETHTIWRNFNYDPVTDALGTCKLSRYRGESTIWATGEIDFPGGGSEIWDNAKLAIGVFAQRTEASPRPAIVAESRIMSIGVTWRHADPAQPVIELR